MPYTNNYVLGFTSDNNVTVKTAVTNLAFKNPFKTKSGIYMGNFTNDLMLVYDTAKLTGEDRLYVVGHGAVEGMMMDQKDAETVAGIIVKKLYIKAIKRISLAVCLGGGDYMTNLLVFTSFGEQFHRILGEKFGLYTEVSARKYLVQVQDDGTKTTRLTLDGDMVNKRNDSKDIYYWDGKVQKRKPAY